MYKRDKRGLSAVVTTLLIILLTIIAVGIIWVVIRNLVTSGGEQIDITTKCTSVDFREPTIAGVTGEDGSYTVTLRRSSGGEAIDGVRLILYNGTNNTMVLEFGDTSTSIGPLQEVSKKVVANLTETGGVLKNANKIRYTPYFNDDSNTAQLCPDANTKEYTFTLA